MRNLLPQIFTDIDKAGINCLIIRNYEQLPDTEPGDDVDILVHRDDMTRLCRLLKDQGFLIVKDLFPHVFALFFDQASGNLIKLDLVDHLCFGHTVIMPFPAFFAERVLARKVLCKDFATTKGVSLDISQTRLSNEADASHRFIRFYIPAPEDELLLLFFHCLGDKNRFKLHYQQKIMSLFEKSTDKDYLSSVFVRIFGLKDGRKIFTLLEISHFDGLIQFHSRFMCCLARELNGEGLLHSAKIFWQRASRKFLGRKGLRIALMGPDGSGKSTLSRLIQKKEICNTDFVYMGRDQFVIPTRRVFKYLRDKIRGEKKQSEEKSSQLETLIPVKGGYRDILDIFRLLHDLTDYYLRYFLYNFLPCRKGFLVINDRYIYDMLSGSEKIQQVPLVKWLIMNFFPAPHFVFILDAPASHMFARKGEHSVEILDEMKERFAKLHSELANSFIIKTESGPEKSANQIIEHIWREYFEYVAKR